jgi:1-deoxy-D-xylulose-5-phosphate reductoisomerase
MVKGISILGSTGSIGRQTAAAAGRLGIPVVSLAANRDAALLEEQARLFHPRYVGVYDIDAAKTLRERLADTDIEVGGGPESPVISSHGRAYPLRSLIHLCRI